MDRYSGNGAHIDILVASARALVNALNKMISGQDPKNLRTVQMPGTPFIPLPFLSVFDVRSRQLCVEVLSVSVSVRETSWNDLC